MSPFCIYINIYLLCSTESLGILWPRHLYESCFYSTPFFLAIYCVSLWHDWVKNMRAGALYGNLIHDKVLAFLIQIIMCVSSTNQLRCLYFTDLLPPACVYVSCYPLKLVDFYYTCVVPHLLHKLYKVVLCCKMICDNSIIFWPNLVLIVDYTLWSSG